MTGLGMGDSRARRAWVTLRRTAVAVATAAVIVGVGSRVNRPVQPGWARAEPPRVADEVLADVRLDERSLASLVKSINAAAGRRRVRLEVETLPVEVLQEPSDASERFPTPGHLRNVRLGWVLGQAGGAWFSGYPVEWREEAGEIVVGGRGTRRQPAEFRTYDVTDLLEGAAAWSDRLRAGARPKGQSNGVPSAAELAQMINEALFPYAWQPNALPHVTGWGGWLLLRGDDVGQRKLEEFLTLSRRGDSGPVLPTGGGR